MSIYQGRSSLLSISPRIHDDGETMEVRTHLLLQAMALGSFCQRAIIDTRRRQIEIQKRRLWLWSTTRTISFKDVDYLNFTHSSLGTSWSWRRRTDQVESYRIGIVLRRTGETIWLATFRGEGATMTGLGGVMMGDSLLDMSGTQEEESTELVDRLSEMLGVGLSPRLLASPTSSEWACTGCGRDAAPRTSSCLYCGARVKHVGSRVARGTPLPDENKPRTPYGGSGGTAL